MLSGRDSDHARLTVRSPIGRRRRRVLLRRDAPHDTSSLSVSPQAASSSSAAGYNWIKGGIGINVAHGVA